MSVIVSPLEQLEFRRPFTQIVKEIITISNPSNQTIAFKIKTTAPKQYCVRPNAGRIASNSQVEVEILLQPIKDELPEDYKCKDKFLVQTSPIPDSDNAEQDITALWNQIETTDRGSIHQHKIKCAFLPPDEGSSSIHAESIATTVIPQPQETTPSSVAPSIDIDTIKNKDKALDIQIKEALEKIVTLEKQLEDVKKERELRNRTSSSEKITSTTVQPENILEKPHFVEGYPPQVVLCVALFVFIITYLFF